MLCLLYASRKETKLLLKQYFQGDNPIGLRIVQVMSNTVRQEYKVLQGEVEKWLQIKIIYTHTHIKFSNYKTNKKKKKG